MHHFVNDRNLHFNSSTKKLNSLLNVDMKHLSVWLKTRSIYFLISHSHFNYPNLIWDQNSNAIQQIIILQKAIRIIFFQP